MSDELSAFLSEKISEYRILAAPLNRAVGEIEYSHRLMRARIETEISEKVPALTALADILNVSSLDILLAPDRYAFVREAMHASGLTGDDVRQQLRAIGPPPRNEELDAIGLQGG